MKLTIKRTIKTLFTIFTLSLSFVTISSNIYAEEITISCQEIRPSIHDDSTCKEIYDDFECEKNTSKTITIDSSNVPQDDFYKLEAYPKCVEKSKNPTQEDTKPVPEEDLNSLPSIPAPTTQEDCEKLRNEAYNNYPNASNTYADWVYESCMQEIGQEPQSETPEPITFSSFEECYKYEYTAFLEQSKRPPVNEQAALRKKCEDIIGAAQSETPNQDTPTSSPTEHCRPLLGMISWDCNVPLLNGGNINQDSLGSSIWTIAANVATDITVIAAYLVIGYIIYGGYLYIFSAGDTGKAMSGKKAIHQALMGLAIVISANVILNSLRIALVGATGSFSADCITTSKCVDPSTMVQSAFSWVIGISGIISAAFMVYAGITYTTSRGDANKVQSAKQIITYALIGMIIVTLAELIVIFASDIINNANDEGMYVNHNLVTKEYHEK